MSAVLLLGLCSHAFAQPPTWLGRVGAPMNTANSDSYMVSAAVGGNASVNMWGGSLFAGGAGGINLSQTISTFPGATIDLVMQQCFGGGFAPGLNAAIPRAPVPKSGYTFTAATNWNQFALNTPANPTQNFTSSWNQSLSAQNGVGLLRHWIQAVSGYPPAGSPPPPPPLSIVTPDPYGPQGASRTAMWFENPTYASPDALIAGQPNPVGRNNARDVVATNQFAVLFAPQVNAPRFAQNVTSIYNSLRAIGILPQDIVVLFGTQAAGSTLPAGTPVNGPASLAMIQQAMAGTLFGDRPNVDSHLFVYSTGHGNSWTRNGGTVAANPVGGGVVRTNRPGNGFPAADGTGSGNATGSLTLELAFPTHESPTGVTITYNGTPLGSILDVATSPVTDLTGMIGTAFYWDVSLPVSLADSFLGSPTDTINISGLSPGEGLPEAVTYNDAGDSWSVGTPTPEPAPWTMIVLSVGSVVTYKWVRSAYAKRFKPGLELPVDSVNRVRALRAAAL